ncbi:hypothetical protein K439DRAFT_1642993 [Ramaria rubella]|nr:hypothetical protein K439DRAFT_1642993 [Ramaria rubella]
MFDHSGVIFHEFAYHVHPEKFCAVISEIAGPQDKARGFDISLDLLGDVRRILMPLSGTQYLAKTEIFRSYSLIGEGVVTWLAHAQSRPGRNVIVKDSWEIAPGFEQLVVQRAIAHKISNGIGRIIEFTSFPDDSVRLNRGYQLLSVPSDPDTRFIDRTHCRTVYDVIGWPIEYFLNPRDILVAFRDAIDTHRELYLKANILHSYITPSSIFFNPKAAEGSKGILINFQHAFPVPPPGYVVDDNMKSIIAQADPDISNRYHSFMSVRCATLLELSEKIAARGDANEDAYSDEDEINDLPAVFTDDLESFYYCFCYVTTSFAPVNEGWDSGATRWTRVVPPRSMQEFLAPRGRRIVSAVKAENLGYKMFDLHAAIKDAFGEAYADVAENMRRWFSRHYSREKIKHNPSSQQSSWEVVDREEMEQPHEVYDRFIRWFNTAIQSVDRKEVKDDCGTPSSTYDAMQKTKMTSTSESNYVVARNIALSDAKGNANTRKSVRKKESEKVNLRPSKGGESAVVRRYNSRLRLKAKAKVKAKGNASAGS